MVEQKIMNCARISITLPQKTLKGFRKYCENNSLKISTKVAELIKKFMEKQK